MQIDEGHSTLSRKATALSSQNTSRSSAAGLGTPSKLIVNFRPHGFATPPCRTAFGPSWVMVRERLNCLNLRWESFCPTSWWTYQCFGSQSSSASK
jgi:hypothetical protein